MGRKTDTAHALSTLEPELVEAEWYAPYNMVLGIMPDSVSTRSSIKVYWKCLDCGHIYKMSPIDRLEKRERNKKPCPACNKLVQLHPFVV